MLLGICLFARLAAVAGEKRIETEAKQPSTASVLLFARSFFF